jgi:hypothetical protein
LAAAKKDCDRAVRVRFSGQTPFGSDKTKKPEVPMYDWKDAPVADHNDPRVRQRVEKMIAGIKFHHKRKIPNDPEEGLGADQCPLSGFTADGFGQKGVYLTFDKLRNRG